MECIESDSDDSSFDSFLKLHKTLKRHKSNEGISINIKKEKEKEKGKSEEVKKSTKIKQEQGLKNIIKKEYQELKHNQKDEENLSEDEKDQQFEEDENLEENLEEEEQLENQEPEVQHISEEEVPAKAIEISSERPKCSTAGKHQGRNKFSKQPPDHDQMIQLLNQSRCQIHHQRTPHN